VLWLETVGIPYLALIALATMAAGRGREQTVAEIFVDLGIDACILGIGISGAVFANAEIRAGENAGAIGIAGVLVDLAITGICLRLREWRWPSEGWRAVLSLFLGVFILVINTAIVVRGLK
jgi:hypothetical protein